MIAIARRPKRKKRTYGRLTQRDVLKLVRRGRLRVDVETGEVRRPDGTLYAVQEDDHGYLFVRIYHRGKRRGQAVNRLVWMVANNRVVPRGHDIHHDDRNRQNNNHGNLSAELAGPHRSEARRLGWEEARGYPESWDLEEEPAFT